jgi:hypothetical protein
VCCPVLVDADTLLRNTTSTPTAVRYTYGDSLQRAMLLSTGAGRKTRNSLARSARLVRISSRAELSFQLGRYNESSRASSRAAHELIELSVKGQMIYTQPSKLRSPNGPAQHWKHILRPRRPAKKPTLPQSASAPTRQLPRRPHASRAPARRRGQRRRPTVTRGRGPAARPHGPRHTRPPLPPPPPRPAGRRDARRNRVSQQRLHLSI